MRDGIGPLISVIIPVRNAVRTIGAAIESVVSQTYGRVELIVVDGQSTDGTLDVMKRFGDSINCLISEPDGGIYEAMNKGISRSTGGWLLFLGADDRLIGNDVLHDIYVKYGREIPKDIELIFGQGTSNQKRLKNSFDWRMFKGNSLNHQCVFYRRSVFKNRTYDTSYKIAADYKLNLTLLRLGAKAMRYDGLVAVFGDDGLSHRYVKIARGENERARKEVLGETAGSLINLSRALMDRVKELIGPAAR